MGFSTEGFVTVEAEKNPTWNCLSVKNPTDGLPAIKLEVNDNSWIAGYYLGMKQIPGKKNSKGEETVISIHTLQLLAVGDPKHLSEPVAVGEKVQFFGKSALDDNLIKNVSLGHAVHIKWIGLQPNKQNPANPYHGFTVMVNPNDKIEALPRENTSPVSTVKQEPQQLSNTTIGNGQSLSPQTIEDDIPF